MEEIQAEILAVSAPFSLLNIVWPLKKNPEGDLWLVICVANILNVKPLKI